MGKPETIGTDRLALMAAAAHFYPEKNNLVIALGSCITYNFLNQYHEFLGGGITPGMDMRFRSMHEYTAKLPQASAEWHFPLIGYDTKTNLQSGVIVGIINEIEGFIGKYSEKYGNFNVVLTAVSYTHLDVYKRQACGCAVVCTDIGGHADYAINKETALLTVPGNAEDMADKLKTLINDKELRCELATASNKLIGASFSWKNSVQKLISYMQVADR